MHTLDSDLILGGSRAADLAERFGTPLYVYELDAIKQRFTQVTTDISYRPLRIHFACKAHSNVVLLRFLRSLGAGLDACSPGDLAYADAAGFTADEIIYTGNSVSDLELRDVADRRIIMNADSLCQLERSGAFLAEGTKIGLRVNCGVLAGFHPHVQSATASSKFGIHPGQVAAALTICSQRGLSVVGLHAHLGSDLFDVAPAIDALNHLIHLSNELSDLEYIDVGGGWGVPFEVGGHEFDMATYGAEVTARMSALSELRSRPVLLRVEPGAYLMSDAGWLLMRVTDLKPPVALGAVTTPWFAGTDSSYNHVFSAAFYDSFHEVVVADRADAPRTVRYHVTGNLMQAGDVLAKDRDLPVLHVGDVLAMRNCGTYSASRAPVFNNRPRPAEIAASNGGARLIRRRESLSDLLSQQILEGPDGFVPTS